MPVWSRQRRKVCCQEDQQGHNLLFRSTLGGRGTGIICCQRISIAYCTLPYFYPITLSSAPQWPLPRRLLFLLSIALRFSFTHICLLPKPLTIWIHCPAPSSFLLLARCPESGSGQVPGPLPGPGPGCPAGPEQCDALPVASVGARLRDGGFEGSGGASVCREGGAGPCLLHRGLHFHTDTHPHCWGKGKTCRPGQEGDRTHLWQPGGWESGAYGDRWVSVALLRLLFVGYASQIFK